MIPQIMHSVLTGRHYIVTRLRKDGSAAIKYDCTDQINAILANRGAQSRAEKAPAPQPDTVAVPRAVAVRLLARLREHADAPIGAEHPAGLCLMDFCEDAMALAAALERRPGP